MPLTPAQTDAAQTFATAMQPERVGDRAINDLHADLRRSAVELAFNGGGDFREIARFLIEGL